ncbi:unnamed protein product [Triticum turgidum subsp. durum]|uniref:EF-hand domain-containing protein n=1 Tax=Triticum turgidum subsp. durum TaxID=4567 RepID=A0A9R1C292_TRITD|nr:unnamed protein product [Triticum turgidum subsp. durum]
MFPPKGPNPYGQQPPYGGQQSYGGQIPGSSGFGASAAAGARAGQGAAGQYGGPYASVYGTQQVGGVGGKGPDSSSLPSLPPHTSSLSQSSKFSSGSAGSNLARPNDDYMAVRGYAQKLDQYGTDYTSERRMYGEHSANLGRRDGLTDLDRRYPDHLPAAHQIHDRVEQGSTMRHQPLLKAQLAPVSDMRHRSPIKEIKREYLCKVLPFRLVDDERDCLSLTKRYPRLSVIPDFSKIVLNWAKESLNLSLHTPVSLEHAICEDDDKADESALVSSENTSSIKTPETIWNAKVLLMSGMSNGAFADITSMRSTDERVVHLNNILKFAVFKKDRSLLAIGGPWNAALDGGDPLVDCSCLIRTAIRYVKELVQVDLSNCTSWNRFLEVHYNRVGNDGLFSHKEITVLFVPNLSECIPSMDIWRSNWIAYRKSKIEREQLIMKEKSPGDPKEQKQVLEEPSEAKSTNDQLKEGDGAAKIEKIDADMELKEGDGAAKIEKIDAEMELKEGDGATKIEKIDADMEEQGKDGDVNLAGDGGKNPDNVGEQVEKIVGVVEENTSGDASVDHVTEDKKPLKKKIIKKVVKVVRKKPTAEAPVGKSPQVDKNAVAETASKTVQKHIEQKSEDLGKEKAGAVIVQQPEAKKTGKKKVIRRIVKRKVPASATEPTALAAPAEASKQDVDVQPEKIAEGITDAGNSQTKLEEGLKIPTEDISNQKKEGLKTPAEDISNQKKEEGFKTPAEDTSNQKKEQELEIKGDIMTDDQKANTDNVNQQEVVEQKDPKIDETNEKSDQKKDDNETKDKDQKMDSKKKSPIDTKEKKKSDEPPKHPGFILQAKKSKGYKLRSTSLSLDGLLDYTANDTEESVFELSLFAESFSEMLQYRMGCVILSFLEKLYRQYVVRRNQRKRQREEDLKKEDTISLEKRLKTTDENVTGSTSGNPGKNDETIKEGGEKIIGDNSSASHEQLVKEDDEKMSTDHAAQDEMMKEGEEKIDADQSAAAHDEPKADEKMEEEDPEYEEDPDEVEYEGDEDMDDATAEEPAEAQNEDNSNERETKPEEVTAEDDGKRTTENLKLEKTEEDTQSVAEKGDLKEVEEKSAGKEGKISGSQKGDSAKHDVVDKDLLQAFRYFDQNRVGYIKVDDLRCILHNLGKFLSNRDVKDMVQIALAESNSSRDGRIIYTKLVKKADL